MNCPYCGGQTHVLESREYQDSVIRWRECKACGRDCYTKEIHMNYDVGRDLKNKGHYQKYGRAK